ncbi:bifunctional diguanylate cyclase/phosphodiesterase [Synechococcus sp. RS9909]|uniref:putative bifunctional diguanylate cyclase/phosphodiesterase n=1 Tax=Synechococcus sp. RS9909 TaxID=221352 RepID=UPI000325524A|nr:GGDEF domain-containing phosphodiesterase [Synechococcus sp. RS9909]
MQFKRESLTDRLKQLLIEAEQLGMMGSWELIHASGELLWSLGTHRVFGIAPTITPDYALFLSCVHPDERERVDQAYRSSVATGQAYDMRHRVVTPDGQLKVIQARATTSLDRQGKPLRSVGIVQDITALAETEQELARLAFTDPLTTLLNRQALMRELTRRCGDEPGEALALINLDLDGFQAFNDSFGVAAGDRLLVALAARLRDQLPADALIARLESDEFLVVIPAAFEQMASWVDSIQALVGALNADPLQQSLAPTASVGASHFPTHGHDPIALVQSANTALMEAKRRAKQGRCLYSAAISERIHQQLSLEADLQQAIKHQDFHLVFQAQVGRDGALLGAEVLLRWRHPQGHLVPPGVFIPLAEQSGQIAAITDWVLDAACAQVVQWQQKNLQVPRLAINLSAALLGVAHRQLDQVFLATLARYRLDPSAFELEITETALLQHLEVSRNQLIALLEAGFQLAIDDFGTGYASLLTLRVLPATTIKIDGSFVQRMQRDPVDLAIVRRSIQLIHDLGMVALAEGVENEQQQNALLEMGCDGFQGYLFQRPMPAEQFAEHLVALRSA